MAGVSGLRAQFENPQLMAPSGTSPLLPRSPGRSRDGGKDDGAKKSSPKVPKQVLSTIGKSMSHQSQGNNTLDSQKKPKPSKSKSIDDSKVKKNENKVNEKARVALAGVIKSASSSPRGSKLSINSTDGSSPLHLSTSGSYNNSDRFSLSANFDSSFNTQQIERSGEFDPRDAATDRSQLSPLPRTDSDTRKKKALSTPFPALNSAVVESDHRKSDIIPCSGQKGSSKPPVLKPKPSVIPPKPSNFRPNTLPKPPKPSKPKFKNPLNASVVPPAKPPKKEDEEARNGSISSATTAGQENKKVDKRLSIQAKENTKSDREGNSQVLAADSSDLHAATKEDTSTPDGGREEEAGTIQLPSTEQDNPIGSHERDSSSSPNETTGIQSKADVTPKGDVGGCKRSNADSGFQDEPDELKVKESSPEWDAEKMEKYREKRHKIAMELLDTEKTYVSHLKIIAVDFRQCISSLNVKANKPVIPDATMNLIFLNIGEIFNLNTQLLMDLQQRMDEWESKEQIGDVISSIAPFLKLYAMYTAGFEDAMKILTESMSKEKKLDTAVKEFERKIGSGLGVAPYMLEVIQRIPRYKLLLEQYLKYLPEKSSERPLAEKALAIISEAADRSNNRIKELENSNEILAIERSLSDYEGSLLQAHRRFLKKGILQKNSRKTQAPRMFFLFSDVLLHTEVTSISTFKFKDEVPLCGMKLEVPKVCLIPHSFEILGTTRSFILSASCEEERDAWMSALYEAINDEREKRKSIKRDHSQLMTVDRSEFGGSAPIMVPDQNVSQCQLCSKDFTFTFRRHHCRACGRVVCSHCSPFKAYLSYSKKEERICRVCDQRRQQSAIEEDVDGPVQSPLREQPVVRPNVPSIYLVDPKERDEEAVIEGYVLEQEGKKFNRCWYMIDKNLALYKFRAHEDIRATATVPLPGYKVQRDDATSTITLVHPTSKKKKLNLTFRVESKDEFESWYNVIDQATQLVVAEPVHSRDRSPSYLSPINGSPDRKRSQSMSDILACDEKEDFEISV